FYLFIRSPTRYTLFPYTTLFRSKVAYKLLNISSAKELAQVVVAVGLAQNLGALKALATDGIQKGHMTLHSRSVAMAAGATGEMVDMVAKKLVEEKEIRVG